MNWAAMTDSEILSYAPLQAQSDLERRLLELVERSAESLADANCQLDEASDYSDEVQALEARLDTLKDDLFAVLNDEEGDDAQLLKRVREVLEGA